MTLNLDERQRAMLAEMGVRVWTPGHDLPAPAAAGSADTLRPGTAQAGRRPPGTSAPAVPVRQPTTDDPELVANNDHSTMGLSQKDSGIGLPRHSAGVPAVASGVVFVAPAAGAPLEPRPSGIDSMGWPALQAAVAGCRACALCQGRTHTVFGTGERTADWMVVGEAPGEQEDRQGEPFVGPSGQLLDNMLKAIGLSRQVGGVSEGAPGEKTPGSLPTLAALKGVYIANVVKCRPPGNRNPLPEEVAQCDAYLARQVALVRPRIILALGRFAVQSLLQTNEPIGKLRGRVHHYQGVPVIVSYHPAYLLRSLAEKAKAWDDLCLALEVMQQDGSAAEQRSVQDDRT
jgi:DNA polymerase